MHKVGDTVTWTSFGKEKSGIVVQVVPPGELPEPYLYDAYRRSIEPPKGRPHESYVIRVRPGVCGVYWPKVYMLCRTNTEVALAAARRKCRLICADELVVDDPRYKQVSYYCNLPPGHRGKHAAMSGEYPVEMWGSDDGRPART